MVFRIDVESGYWQVDIILGLGGKSTHGWEWILAVCGDAIWTLYTPVSFEQLMIIALKDILSSIYLGALTVHKTILLVIGLLKTKQKLETDHCTLLLSQVKFLGHVLIKMKLKPIWTRLKL